MVRQTPSPAHALVEAVRLAHSAHPEASRPALLAALHTFAHAKHPPVATFLGASRHPYQRLLLNSPHDPFQLVLSLWAPSSRSPIHDHSGLQGAVVCIAGEVLETRYALGEQESRRARLHPASTIRMHGPTATQLHPGPDGQVHALVNPAGVSALTLHAYLGRLDRYFTYEPAGDDWFRIEAQQLWFDATDLCRAWL